MTTDEKKTPDPIVSDELGIVFDYVPETRAKSCDGCSVYDVKNLLDVLPCGGGACLDGYVLRVRPPLLAPDLAEAVQMVLDHHRICRGMNVDCEVFQSCVEEFVKKDNENHPLMLAALEIARNILHYEANKKG